MDAGEIDAQLAARRRASGDTRMRGGWLAALASRVPWAGRCRQGPETAAACGAAVGSPSVRITASSVPTGTF